MVPIWNPPKLFLFGKFIITTKRERQRSERQGREPCWGQPISHLSLSPTRGSHSSLLSPSPSSDLHPPSCYSHPSQLHPLPLYPSVTPHHHHHHPWWAVQGPRAKVGHPIQNPWFFLVDFSWVLFNFLIRLQFVLALGGVEEGIRRSLCSICLLGRMILSFWWSCSKRSHKVWFEIWFLFWFLS